MCVKATLVQSTQSHFRVMAERFSLAWGMSRCYCPPTLGRRLWTLLAFTHTGWLLSPVGEGYLMFVPLAAPLPDSANILTIFHIPILPLLIPLGPTSDLDGTIVIDR